MNKKGFTLVELIAVITVLGLISLLTIPAVGRIIKDNKAKASSVNVDTILNAAYDYAQRNPRVLPKSPSGEAVIPDGTVGETILYGDLEKAGLLKDNMENPKTGARYNDNCEITITYYVADSSAIPTDLENAKWFGNYLFQFVDLD